MAVLLVNTPLLSGKVTCQKQGIRKVVSSLSHGINARAIRARAIRRTQARNELAVSRRGQRRDLLLHPGANLRGPIGVS
jgi:hypothetical protein